MAHDKDTPPSTLSADATDLQARYGHHLEGKELSETQQQEMLQAIWNILVCLVDLGFDVGPGDKFNAKSDCGADDMLSLVYPEETAPETVASPKITNKEEPK